MNRTFLRLTGVAATVFAGLMIMTAPATAQTNVFSSTVPPNGPTPWTTTPQAAPNTLRFAVIGDNTGLARPGVFNAAMRQISWMKPELVMSVGDLVEGYTEDKNEIATEWAGIETSVARLGAPFFYVPGNHDLGNNAALDYWRATRGDPYYAFVYKDALFLVLDTEDPPLPLPDQAGFRAFLKAHQANPEAAAAMLANVNANRDKADESDWMTDLNKSRFSNEQVAFVEAALAQFANVRWTFVFMHKPAWKADDGNFPRIEALLADRPYTMIAGHYHYYEHQVRNGRDYIAMGTTGGSSHQHGPGEMDHIAWITLEEAAPEVALIKLDSLMDRTGATYQPEPRPSNATADK